MEGSPPTSGPNPDPNAVFEELTSIEMFWHDRQELFESRGYTLRPRYRPGWIPSWKANPSLKLIEQEDALCWHMFRTHVLDARRLADGKLVLLKRVASSSPEIRIATYLSSEELRRDPRNHCVPVLDVIVDHQDPSISFLVMPFLRWIDDPEFDTVGSILECIEQLLEGLVFLHEHNVAHRDCAYKNVMMDASNIFPRGFHPMADRSLPNNVLEMAPTMPRSNVPVTYYFTDFGLSSMFSSDDVDRLVTSSDGLDRDLPELSKVMPYNPFKADIFILGNAFRQSFLEKFANVDIIWPLISRMINREPSQRPSAVEALGQFREIRKDVWTIHRLWRARVRDEPLAVQAVFDTMTLASAAFRTMF